MFAVNRHWSLALPLLILLYLLGINICWHATISLSLPPSCIEFHGDKESELCKAEIQESGDFARCIKTSEQNASSDNTELYCKAQFGLADCLVEAACKRCNAAYMEQFFLAIEQQIGICIQEKCSQWESKLPRLGCKYEWQCTPVRDQIDARCKAEAFIKYPNGGVSDLCQREFYHAECSISGICKVCQSSIVHDWILQANGDIDSDQYANCTAVNVPHPKLHCSKLSDFTTIGAGSVPSTTATSNAAIIIIIVVLVS